VVVTEPENNVRDIPQNSISNLYIMDSVGSTTLWYTQYDGFSILLQDHFSSYNAGSELAGN